jgi:hypothetical protein
MVYLHAALNQQLPPADLPGAVRAVLGKPLRRAAGLTQLALLGAFDCLPEERRHLPTALLWQSTSGPRLETITLLEEICTSAAEPMPYDFLATQPAIAAAQIQPMLPGLHSAMHIPLDSEKVANWSLLLNLAIEWLNEERYAQVLCAQLDLWPDSASGHWLCVGAEPLENSLASLQIATEPSQEAQADTPDFPARLADWLNHGKTASLSLHSPAAPRLAVEFTRL